MEKPNLTAEQKAHLDTHLAGIGHNLGPKLEEHAETVQEQVSRHGQLRAEATNIRVRLLGPSLAERVTRRSRLYFVI